MFDSKDKKNKKKRVVKRLSYIERRADLTQIIRELGIWRLPSQRRLAERYSVSQQQISKDLEIIFTTLPDKVLNEIFFEFFSADQKAQIELRKILQKGSVDEKLKAVSIMIQLQNAFTNLLEKYGRKPVVPDKVELVEAKDPWKNFDKEVKEYASIFEKLTEEEQYKLKMALLEGLEN
jgi:hypothetical protein